jgi:hypothetical protein
MHHIVYNSCAVGQQTTADLTFLLQQARTNNAQLGITGLLLYGNGSFVQVLEGEEAAVRHIYGVIQEDYRHTRVLTLSDGPIQRRTFQNWTMGFQPLSGENFERISGYINPYRSNCLDAHLPVIDEGMLELLKSFVEDESSQI